MLVQEATLAAPAPDVEGRIMASIWTGYNSRLGEPTFEDSTSAYYDEITYTPFTDIEQPPAPPLVGEFLVELVNTDTQEVVAILQDGMTVDRDLVGDANLTVNVIAYDRDLRTSMRTLKIDVDGALDRTQTEQYGPWALFGDPDRETLNGRPLPDGDYGVTLTAYSGWNSGGVVLEEQSFSFAIAPVDDTPAEPSPGFTALLFDAESREAKAILEDGATIDPDELLDGRSTILVQLDDPALAAAAASVVMTLEGPVSKTSVQGVEPFALFGDAGFNKMTGSTLTEGDYTFQVAVTSGKGGGGEVLAEQTVDFTVAEDPADDDGLTVFLVDADNDLLPARIVGRGGGGYRRLRRTRPLDRRGGGRS